MISQLLCLSFKVFLRYHGPMPEIPCATTQVFTLQQSTEASGEAVPVSKNPSALSPPLSPQRHISEGAENEESRFSACSIWLQVNPIFLDLLPPQCWIWDTKEPPWKSDFIGRLQHHPKGTEIPATTPWLQQLLDQTLNTVVAALTPLKMLTTAFTDQHLLPGYQCKSTLILDFPNN